MTIPRDHRCVFVRPLMSASSARLPPSPLLSARMMMVTYFRVTTSIIDQNIRLMTPNICRSEEHTSELQSLMRISYAVFCLNKKINLNNMHHHIHTMNYNL